MDELISPVARIMARCGTPGSVMPPTELYNKGWMLRLCSTGLTFTATPSIHWHSQKAPGANGWIY